MNLLQVRTQVAKNSGRYDLVTDAASDDYSDNGLDFYINAAITMLDRLLGVPETYARLFYGVSSGEYSLTFQHSCRVLEECWCNDSESRWPLEKVDLGEFKEYYKNLASATTTDTPKYFSIARLRALETTDQTSLGTFIDVNHAEDDTNYDYTGILFGPPADGDYVIEVSGKFKNATLSSDSDENFWTIQEADLLIRTTMYKLEGFSRGTENAKNWLSAIQADILEIDKDVAEEESYGVNQLEG